MKLVVGKENADEISDIGTGLCSTLKYLNYAE
jgi:hypothetical protein